MHLICFFAEAVKSPALKAILTDIFGGDLFEAGHLIDVSAAALVLQAAVCRHHKANAAQCALSGRRPSLDFLWGEVEFFARAVG